MIYLASPYSHESKIVREYRFKMAAYCAAWLVQQDNVVFSPICHSHPMAVEGGLSGTWEFWQQYDLAFLEFATEMVVVTLDGWYESKGVMAEMAEARFKGIPVSYLNPITLELAE